MSLNHHASCTLAYYDDLFNFLNRLLNYPPPPKKNKKKKNILYYIFSSFVYVKKMKPFSYRNYNIFPRWLFSHLFKSADDIDLPCNSTSWVQCEREACGGTQHMVRVNILKHIRLFSYIWVLCAFAICMPFWKLLNLQHVFIYIRKLLPLARL